MTKHSQLLELARKRQQARWEGVHQVGCYHQGFYESDHVSPYTRSAGRVDADVFLMLQDWCSHSWLSRHKDDLEVRRLGYSPKLLTNINVISLLETHFGLRLEDTYATNLFPFVKAGGLSSPVQDDQLLRAAETFALPQVHIVRPKLVVCLGLVAGNAIRRACGLNRTPDLATAIANPFDHVGVRFWSQAHPGYFGQLSRNRVAQGQVAKDWTRMAEWLRCQGTRL